MVGGVGPNQDLDHRRQLRRLRSLGSLSSGNHEEAFGHPDDVGRLLSWTLHLFLSASK